MSYIYVTWETLRGVHVSFKILVFEKNNNIKQIFIIPARGMEAIKSARSTVV